MKTTENIQKDLERALSAPSLNLSYIRVEQGAMDESKLEDCLSPRVDYYTSVGVEPALEPEDLERAIAEVMPSEWCSHDYDCCGGWYQGSVNVVKRYANVPDSGSYLVTVSWNQNV